MLLDAMNEAAYLTVSALVNKGAKNTFGERPSVTLNPLPKTRMEILRWLSMRKFSLLSKVKMTVT